MTARDVVDARWKRFAVIAEINYPRWLGWMDWKGVVAESGFQFD